MTRILHRMSLPKQPSFKAKLQENTTRIETALDTTTPFDWNNLLAILEEADHQVEQHWAYFSHLHAVQNTPSNRKIYDRCLPLLIDYETQWSQHKQLYEAVKSIKTEALSSTKQKIIDDLLHHFERAGVHLSAPKKKRLETIQKQLAKDQTQFEQHLVDAELAYTLPILDKARLEGLPQHTLQTAAKRAREKNLEGYLLGIDPPCYQAIMLHATDRALRETIYRAYITRASDVGPHAGQFDNSPLLSNILKLRHEEALILGFPNYASYALDIKMAKTLETATQFLEDLLHRARPQAEKEYQALLTFAKMHDPLDALAPWDIAFISERLKEQCYAFHEEDLRPYFQVNTAWRGIQHVLQQLYGVQLVERPDIKLWHEDAMCFQLEGADHQAIGLLYVDLYARPYKRTGAWMDTLQTRMKRQNNDLQLPIATLTCNFAAPQPGEAATLLHDDLITLLHEMGHCLHHLLTQVDEYSASGMHGVEWDAVELPSQLFEHWGWHADTLHLFTTKPLPPELIQNLIRSKTFHTGLHLLKQLELALFDLKIHAKPPQTDPQWVLDILATLRQTTSLFPVATYNRFPHSFSHIFAGGYAAGYYSYLWAEVLASDCFSRFEQEGLLNTETGHAFLNTILATGSSRTANEHVKAFLGREMSMEAFLRHQGFDEHQK